MSELIPATFSLFSREQFRLCRFQVYNWGTFSGLHTIPIAEQGFLFVGRSGSGKSTLLDGIAALLTPPRFIDFNAAAREAERSGRDRNWVTYVRGAWAEQKDDASGEIATRYLRPGTTWSALALTYQNSLNQTVTLVQLFWLRGNANNNADVRRYFLIFERAFDLREVEHFDLDVRKLKQKFNEAFITDEFRPYCERFCRLLGLENEMALRLLHKTQSAKNLGDLNIFLRDFMLEKPETFAVADRLVSEFAELDAAYLAVVTAREQIQILAPAHQAYQQLQALHQEKSRLHELILGLDPYREKNRLHLLTTSIAELAIQAEGIGGEVRRHESLLANQVAALRDLEQQHRDLGGGRIEQFEAEKQTLEARRDEHLRKRDQAQTACRQLDWALAESPQAFAELTGKARTEMENWQKHSQSIRDDQIELSTRKREVEKEFANTVKEVNALRSQPSNIPAEMLELRKRIAQAIGLERGGVAFCG